jgi:LPXTG-motif cell wall-anchored protein
MGKRIKLLVSLLTCFLLVAVCPAILAAAELKTYTLVYEANGGTGSMDPEEHPEGYMMKLPECGFKAPEGKKFSKWEVSGTDLYGTPGSEFEFSSNCAVDGVITATAQWIDAPAATIKTAPQARNYIYMGIANDLVDAGEAEGGTIQYALGEDNKNAPTTGWSKKIPQGADAKPYYVWYMAVGDATHSDSKKSCVVVHIDPKPINVKAKDQTVKEGKNPESTADNVEAEFLLKNHTIGEITIKASGDKLVPSGAKIVSGEKDVTGNYDITYYDGNLTVIPKISFKVTYSVKNGEWDNGGSDDIEVVLEGYEGDTLKLAADQIPGAGTKPSDNYKQGAWNNTPVTNMEITQDTSFVYSYDEDPVYTATVQGDGYTQGSGKDIVITVKRNVSDDKTFGSFVSATMDGSAISENDYEKASGSLVMTIKSSYLDTLSEGSHDIKIMFTDGEAAVSVTIAKASAPIPLPQTGENTSVNSFIGIALLLTGALGLSAAVRFSRASNKKEDT